MILDVAALAAGAAIGGGLALCIAGCFPRVPDLAQTLARARDGTPPEGLSIERCK